MIVLIVCPVIAMTIWRILSFIERREGKLPVKKGILWYAGILCVPEGILISVRFCEKGPFGQIFVAVFAGCLLSACITDLLCCQVYNIVWWIGLAASIAVWCLFPPSGRSLFGLCVFLSLQFGIFARTYGKADCYAFCTCAVMGVAFGFELQDHLMQMILAYLMLIVVQAFRKNISAHGRLKHAVPFVPYINISFWIILICI